MAKILKGAGVLLVSTDGLFILQQRSKKDHKFAPKSVSVFGGSAEVAETPKQTALRELKEETELDLSPKDLTFLCRGREYRPDLNAEVDYEIFCATNIDKSQIVIHEGAGIYELDPYDDMSMHMLAPRMDEIIQSYRNQQS